MSKCCLIYPCQDYFDHLSKAIETEGFFFYWQPFKLFLFYAQLVQWDKAVHLVTAYQRKLYKVYSPLCSQRRKIYQL